MSTPRQIVTTYITEMRPGILFPEVSVREVPERDPQQHAEQAHPAVFGFRYYDVTSTVVNVDREDQVLSGQPAHESPYYYIDAEVVTLADTEDLPGDVRILQANMRGNGWDRVVKCRTGNFRPLLAEDVVIRTLVPPE